MPNNTQNNNSWRSLLEDDTAFAAGDLPATDAVWDKLYEKLHTDKKRKKRIGYWSIAAALLPLALLGVLMLKRNNPAGRFDSANAKPREQHQMVIDNGSKPVKFSGAVTGHENEIKNTATGAVVIKHVIDRAQAQALQVIPVGHPVDRDTADAVHQVAVIRQEEKDSGQAAIAAVQPKARLKVVHVNELGETAEKTSIHKEDYSVIQFGMRPQPVYNSSPGSGKIGINISTGKTSPSN